MSSLSKKWPGASRLEVLAAAKIMISAGYGDDLKDKIPYQQLNVAEKLIKTGQINGRRCKELQDIIDYCR